MIVVPPRSARCAASRSFVLLLSLVLLAAGTASAKEMRISPPPLSAEDVFVLEYASDPRVSPDGTRVVYVRRANDVMTDRTRANLWVVDSDGARHRPLVSGPLQASSPRWSPSGDRIAWFQDAEAGTELRVRWLEGGETAVLATLTESPDDLLWAPDGSHLAFTRAVPAPTEPLAPPRSPPEGADWSEPVEVFDAVRYKRDGKGFVERAYSHVFVVPADGGHPRQLTGGDFDHAGPLAFTADGGRILFSANRSDEAPWQAVETDLWAVDIASGTLERITERAGAEYAPAISPDGRRLAYLHDHGRPEPYRLDVLRLRALDGSGDDRALTTAPVRPGIVIKNSHRLRRQVG